MLRPYIYGDYCEGVLRKNADEVVVFGKEYVFTGYYSLYVNYSAKGVQISFSNLTDNCKMSYGIPAGCNFTEYFYDVKSDCTSPITISKTDGIKKCNVLDSRIKSFRLYMESVDSTVKCNALISVKEQ